MKNFVINKDCMVSICDSKTDEVLYKGKGTVNVVNDGMDISMKDNGRISVRRSLNFVIDDRISSPLSRPDKLISFGKNLEDVLKTDFYFDGAFKKENNNEDTWYRELGKAIEYIYSYYGYIDINTSGCDKLEDLIEEFYKLRSSNSNAYRG